MNKEKQVNWHKALNIAIILFLLVGVVNIPTANVFAQADENKKPVISQGETASVSMDKNRTPQAFELTLSIENFTEGDTFAWSISAPASHGSASVGPDGKESAVSYLPERDYVGEDAFTVQVVNQFNESDEILVQVSVLEPTPTPTTEPKATQTAAPEATQTVEPVVEYSNPNFAGYITLDFIAEQLLAYGWAASTPVTLSIDNPSTGTGEDYSETVNMSTDSTPAATFAWPSVEIETGATLTVSGDGDSVQLVNNLEVVDVNVYQDTVGGRGSAGAQLTVSIMVGERFDRKLTIDSNGFWNADFKVSGGYPYGSVINFSTVPTGWVQSIESNGNLIKNEIPDFPRYISIRFSNPTNYIGSFHWPENALLTLTIDDPTNGEGIDYTDTIINDDDSRGYFLDLIDFPLTEGQVIKVSDGTSTLSMVVPKFYIRQVDADTDIICGTAAPGAEVSSIFSLGTYPNFSFDRRYSIVGEQGNWCFDYSSPTDGIDITDDTNLHISQFDENGNKTDLGGLSTTFTDVYYIYKEVLGGTNYYMHRYIQALYDAGLTAGTSSNPAKFSPKLNLDRSMAAVFMLRGNFGTSYNPPAAPWNTFTNDDWTKNSYAQKWAEGLYQAHLTAGCQESPFMFCPDRTLTREEAVVFALHLKYDTIDGEGNVVSYNPPAASGTVFADMTNTDHWGTKWAEKAYADGILPACGTTLGKPDFCPNDPVDRAWAAYMIVKAKNLTLP